MNIRLFKAEDYQTLSEWWDEFPDEPKPALAELPVTSFVVHKDERPLAFMSMFVSNGDWVMLEGLIADPDLHKDERRSAVEELVSHCYSMARDAKARRVLGVTMRESLAKRYTELGMSIRKTNVFLLERVL